MNDLQMFFLFWIRKPIIKTAIVRAKEWNKHPLKKKKSLKHDEAKTTPKIGQGLSYIN